MVQIFLFIAGSEEILQLMLSRLTVVSHEAKKKQHAHVFSGLRNHYSELFHRLLTIHGIRNCDVTKTLLTYSIFLPWYISIVSAWTFKQYTLGCIPRRNVLITQIMHGWDSKWVSNQYNNFLWNFYRFAISAD